MGRVVVAALACTAAANSASASDNTPDASGMPRGEYHGELWSDAMLEAVTEFYGETRNGRDGVYRFGVGDAQEKGSLFNCKHIARREYRCSWKDDWGVGQLDMTFNEDLSAFTGVWSDESNPPSLGLRWNGARR